MAIERTLDELQERGDFGGVITECDRLLNTRLASVKKAVVLRHKGLALAKQSEGNLHLAVAAFREGLGYAKGHPDAEGPLLASLVAAYSLAGNCTQCREYLSALECLAETHASLRTAIPYSLFNLGYAYDRAELLQEAASTYQRALDLCSGQPMEASVANNLASVLVRIGRLDEFHHFLAIVKRHGNTGFESVTLDSEAAYNLAVGDISAAKTKAIEALSHPSCDISAKGQITFTLARIALTEGDTEEALSLGLQAMAIGQSIPSSLIVDRAARFLQALETRGVS